MQEQAAVLHNKDLSFLQMNGHLNLVLQVTKRWYKVYVQHPPGTQVILSMVVDLWPSVKKKIKLHLFTYVHY